MHRKAAPGKKKLTNKSKSKNKGKGEKVKAEDLVKHAEYLVETFEYEEASRYYQEALNLEPKNTILMDRLAELFLEMGDLSNAFHLLKQSIHLAPEGEGLGGVECVSKYLNLGQLLNGAEAVATFEKGIHLMLKLRASPHIKDLPEEVDKLNKQLCTACCSIAEIFMTDLCEEPSAEKQCSEWVERAIQADPNNPEGYQSLASLSLSQNNKEKAVGALEKSISLWSSKEREEWPSAEFRTATSKLLMEVHSFEKAAEILENLLEENDSVIDLWFLQGFAYSHFDPTESRRYLETALKMIEKDPEDNENIKSEIEKILEKLPPPTEQGMEEEGKGGGEDDEDEWIDVDEDEEEGGDDGEELEEDTTTTTTTTTTTSKK